MEIAKDRLSGIQGIILQLKQLRMPFDFRTRLFNTKIYLNQKGKIMTTGQIKDRIIFKKYKYWRKRCQIDHKENL